MSAVEILLHRQLGTFDFVADVFLLCEFLKYKSKIGEFSSKNSFRDVSLSWNGPGRDAGHFVPFRDCPGQLVTLEDVSKNANQALSN